MSAYAHLKRHFYRIGTLAEIDAMLSWDMETMMPNGAQEARAEQVALLETHIHALTREHAVEEWLNAANDEPLDERDRANLVEMRRRWVHATAVDDALVEAFSRARSKCGMVWRQARADDRFADVQPYLEEVVNLSRQQGEARAQALGCSTYDALLDAYDPDASEAQIGGLFAELERFLPALTQEIIDAQRREPAPLPVKGHFPAAAQRAVAKRVMTLLGFDFERGRLDESLHPFCGGIPDDVRITTRYDEEDFFFGLLGVVHETGHALYEQGLPIAWRRLPGGMARSMSVHESQSLLYEMQLGCGLPFLSQLAPILRDEFGLSGPAWTPENLHRVATRVEPGLIRIRADEVTYPAHVVLRFQLERALIAGDLRVADLPGAWREGMQRLLGVAPANDADGVLQDIHWYEGLIGYFPTYTLGALSAAQIFAAAREDQAVEGELQAGRFDALRGWLRRNVHQHGSLVSSGELMLRATGAPLGTDAFRRHLERRYLHR